MTTSSTESSADRFSQGATTFKSVFGTPSDDFVKSVDALAPGFGQMIIELEFGDIYNRPGLDVRTRELCIIAACAAQGATGYGAVRMHVPAALRNGATEREIVEVLVQVAMAAGLPAALGALEVAAQAFSDARIDTSLASEG